MLSALEDFAPNQGLSSGSRQEQSPQFQITGLRSALPMSPQYYQEADAAVSVLCFVGGVEQGSYCRGKQTCKQAAERLDCAPIYSLDVVNTVTLLSLSLPSPHPRYVVMRSKSWHHRLPAWCTTRIGVVGETDDCFNCFNCLTLLRADT